MSTTIPCRQPSELIVNEDVIFNIYSYLNSHNLRSHQKIRHAEYQGEGVTITTVRKSRSSATSSFNQPPTHSQASSLIISPPPPPSVLNLNASDMKTNLPMYKSDWNSANSLREIMGGNHFYCWCWTLFKASALTAPTLVKKSYKFSRYISKKKLFVVKRWTRV